MNPKFESASPEPTPPRVKIVEENPASHKTADRTFSTIPDANVKNPDSMSATERNDAFSTAYNGIVGNEKLERLAVKGFISGKGDMSFANLMNQMTEVCISLSDSEIDTIMRKFGEILRSKAFTYANEFGLTGKQLENLQIGMRNEHSPSGALTSQGIKSVAHFVRARKKLHELEPKTIPGFYFENYLDASHKIDLMEVIEGDNGAVLNLIQIKSREYGPGDIENNTQSHKAWIDGFAIDLESYEKNFSVEPENSPEMREFLTNVQNIQDIFIELLTGGEAISKQILFEKLGLGQRPKVEQVWIMNEYLSVLVNDVDELKVEGVIDEEDYIKCVPLFDEIQAQLDAVKYQKKDLTGISEIHSICAVNEKEVSDIVIFRAEGEKRKSIKIER